MSITNFEGLTIDNAGRLITSDGAPSNAYAFAIAVDVVATLLGGPGGSKISIQNLGPNDIYVGGAAVTAASGTKVPANGGSAEFETSAALYAICAVLQATPFDTRVLVTGP